VLSEILRHRYGLRRTLRELRTRLPQWLAARRKCRSLIHTYLKKRQRVNFDSRGDTDVGARFERTARATSRSP